MSLLRVGLTEYGSIAQRQETLPYSDTQLHEASGGHMLAASLRDSQNAVQGSTTGGHFGLIGQEGRPVRGALLLRPGVAQAAVVSMNGLAVWTFRGSGHDALMTMDAVLNGTVFVALLLLLAFCTLPGGRARVGAIGARVVPATVTGLLAVAVVAVVLADAIATNAAAGPLLVLALSLAALLWSILRAFRSAPRASLLRDRR